MCKSFPIFIFNDLLTILLTNMSDLTNIFLLETTYLTKGLFCPSGHFEFRPILSQGQVRAIEIILITGMHNECPHI